jgi:GMP synthase (glutamine-hydrolysing)
MILIIDFGSQFNQLIARRVREHEVYCQIEPCNISISKIKSLNPVGIILSGGPSSIYAENSPVTDKAVFELNVPVLGICYGMQYMVHALGGKIKEASKREYGYANLNIIQSEPLFRNMGTDFQCWMSHGDSVIEIPEKFVVAASTENTPVAAIANNEKKFYGLQFHPEVEHSINGKAMIGHFLFDVCRCPKNWTMRSFCDNTITMIRDMVESKKVIMGLSGGVDSSVAATLIHKAIGKQLFCIFVDNGLLRKNEREILETTLARHLDLNISFIDAKEKFLAGLKGITDPEKKRKIIGQFFIEVFEAEAAKISGAEFLGQGTLYPDIIESRSAWGGPSSIIKSHHNVGGLPENMKLKLIEPLHLLFKDEVRKLGEQELGISEELIWRQPFPGPGLAIRIMGEVTGSRLDILREADAILLEEIQKAGLYKKLWQSFAVLLPVKSVGVMGDKRTFANCIAIRAVTSNDAMTADWAKLPHELLGKISNRIINEVKHINRVVFDITSKPPGTIEWE